MQKLVRGEHRTAFAEVFELKPAGFHLASTGSRHNPTFLALRYSLIFG
jgi:hypothetical protein